MAGLCLAVVALLIAPGAGAESGGSISGVVTSASTHAPIGGVEVCAASTVIETAAGESQEAKEEGEAEPASESSCANTNGSGQYTITGLVSGSFYVEFRGSQVSADLVAQFYNGTIHASQASPVSVSAGGTTGGINAAMQRGAEISGTVTAATGGAPLQEVAVCARPSPPEEEEEGSPCAITNASGAYTIFGLPSGSYAVAFADPLLGRYEGQYYDDKSTFAEATVLNVTAPNVTTGINAALGPRKGRGPGGLFLPPGSSNGSSPGTAKSPTAGSQGALASGFDVAVHSTKISVRSGLALVQLHCRAACRGTLTLEATQTIKHGGKKRKRTIAIGTASFSIAAEQTAVVKVRLNATGRALLKRAHGRLDVRVSVTQMVPAPKRIKLVDARLLAHAAQTHAHHRKP